MKGEWVEHISRGKGILTIVLENAGKGTGKRKEKIKVGRRC